MTRSHKEVDQILEFATFIQKVRDTTGVAIETLRDGYFHGEAVAGGSSSHSARNTHIFRFEEGRLYRTISYVTAFYPTAPLDKEEAEARFKESLQQKSRELIRKAPHYEPLGHIVGFLLPCKAGQELQGNLHSALFAPRGVELFFRWLQRAVDDGYLVSDMKEDASLLTIGCEKDGSARKGAIVQTFSWEKWGRVLLEKKELTGVR